MMNRQDSTAIPIARAHRHAWSHRDWEKTRELLAPVVHAVVRKLGCAKGSLAHDFPMHAGFRTYTWRTEMPAILRRSAGPRAAPAPR